MKITLITLGKLKDKHFQTAEQHYEKLLSPFCAYEKKELKDELLRKESMRETVLKKEEERIFKSLDSAKRCIVLDEKGKTFSSAAFSDWLRKYNETGEPLQFLIGGAWGLSEGVKDRADETISLSPLTLPHQIARIVFLEQLYRAFTIMKGKRYHY